MFVLLIPNKMGDRLYTYVVFVYIVTQISFFVLSSLVGNNLSSWHQ